MSEATAHEPVEFTGQVNTALKLCRREVGFIAVPLVEAQLGLMRGAKMRGEDGNAEFMGMAQLLVGDSIVVEACEFFGEVPVYVMSNGETMWQCPQCQSFHLSGETE